MPTLFGKPNPSSEESIEASNAVEIFSLDIVQVVARKTVIFA